MHVLLQFLCERMVSEFTNQFSNHVPYSWIFVSSFPDRTNRIAARPAGVHRSLVFRVNDLYSCVLRLQPKIEKINLKMYNNDKTVLKRDF